MVGVDALRALLAQSGCEAGAISCGDEARGYGLAWGRSLENSRGKVIGRTLRFLNFEVKFIVPPEKDHDLSCQQKINQHDSPLKPSVCGLDLGDCPYVALENCLGIIGEREDQRRNGDGN
jgi:hypothetical protein